MPASPANLADPGWLFRTRAALRRSALGRSLYARKRPRQADVFVLSYPKTGRTWLRVMLGKALALHHGLDSDDFDLKRAHETFPGLPRLRFKHDDNPHTLTPGELVEKKNEYAHCKVCLLVRDPRDTFVSAYFQLTRRETRVRFTGDMGDFLDCPRGSIDSMIRFYNIWADQQHMPRDFMLMRYEDIHQDAARELRRLLSFMGLNEVSDETIQQAVEFSRFDNMRKMEQKAAADPNASSRIKPGDASDAESFKTRKGKVGGYVEYLNQEQIARLNAKLATLDPMYGYTG